MRSPRDIVPLSLHQKTPHQPMNCLGEGSCSFRQLNALAVKLRGSFERAIEFDSPQTRKIVGTYTTFGATSILDPNHLQPRKITFDRERSGLAWSQETAALSTKLRLD